MQTFTITKSRGIFVYGTLFTAILFGIFAGPASKVSGQDLPFVEKFAIADDRTAVLEQLIPGTQDYYFFHCLHYQNTQQLDKVTELLEPWIKRYGTSARVLQIQNRQALLSYDNDPKESLEYIKNKLNLQFAHQKEVQVADQNLPSKLNQNLFDVEKLITDNLLQSSNTDRFEDAALPLIGDRTQTHTRLTSLLSRVQWPDFPNLVDLLAEELAHKSTRGFGNIPIHNNLTLEQMDQLQTKVRELKNDTRFVNVYLKKLRPSNDADWEHDLELQAEHLAQVWNYVDKLDPAHNSLKACVRYHQLLTDQKLGQYDREKFLSYLQLPRNVAYGSVLFLKRLKENRTLQVDFNSNFQAVPLVPIGSDEKMVADYLREFLKTSADIKEFRPYIKTEFLETQWATANILRGTGDVEQWASMLSPERYKSLVERVDLEFDVSNQLVFKAADPVQLKLATKNIDKLIVKIFEINTENYYRRFGKEIDTQINLDGLVPNDTLTFEYDEPAARRVVREFEFPKLEGRGVYVIDFIGNGKSSRAIIRKGQYSGLKQIVFSGHEFTVIDENGDPVVDAELIVGGQVYTAKENAEGKRTNKIVVPFSTQPGMQNVIIRKDGFCSLEKFNHRNETYTLTAGLHVDRESLLRSRKSQIVVRPQLKLSGVPVPVGLLENVRLQITTTDLDGDTATITKTDIELSELGESVVEFQVPPRLHKLSFRLMGDIKSMSTAQRINTVTSHALQINEIDKSEEIQDVHLVRSGADYLLEVRGRSGENRPQQAVVVSCKSRFLKQPINFNMQSSPDGIIELGELAGIEWVSAQCGSGSPRQWNLETDGQTSYASVHSLVGNVVRIAAPPTIQNANRSQVGLFEVRQGSIVRDWFDSVVVDDGLIGITDLEAGDYQLVFKDTGKVTQIRITDGKLVGTTLLGAKRHLETRAPIPLHIQNMLGTNAAAGDENNKESAKNNDKGEKLAVKIGGTNPSTRVHVFATRYHPRFNPLSQMGKVRDTEPAVILPGIRRSTFMAGRKIGDEYQYILDRRYATKFVGNMLDRPGLLLNPFDIGNAGNQRESLQRGNSFNDSQDQSKESRRGGKSASAPAGDVNDFANLNFLNNETLVLANLKPDEDGVVEIDPAKLGEKQHLVVVAVDMHSMVQRSFAMSATKPETRDLRLAKGFDPESNVSQSKQTELLEVGKEFVIDDVALAKFQSFDDLGDIYLVLQALNQNANLAKFGFVLQWPNKTQEQKQSLYSEYACHELNFFIYKKDKKFFRAVVKPYIKNKREKTFIDHYLLGTDLSDYAKPSAFSDLNAMEKILLSQRLEDRRGDLQQHLNDLYLFRPTRRAYAGKLYDSTVAAGTIIGDESSIDSGIQNRLKDQSRGLPPLASQWSDKQRTRSTTTMQTQTRTRMIPVQKTRLETRTRMITLEDGSQVQQSYTVSVPYTENVTQNYTVQVPVQSDQPYSIPQSAPNTAKPTQRLNYDFGLPGGANGHAGEGQVWNRPSSDLNGKGVVVRGVLSDPIELDDLKAQDSLVFESRFDDFYDSDGEELPGEVARLYRRIAITKEAIEQHYFQQPLADQNFARVRMNRFWRDYTNHEGGTFISTHFAEAHSSFTEMMFALSVIDLPFTAAEHEIEYVENEMRLTPGSPMIALHQQIRPAIVERRNTTVLVSENFFRKNDRYRFEDEMRFDKFVSDKFAAHTLYGGQVVLTNPTSSPRSVELLIQIPRGSVAVAQSKTTQTIDVSLAAFSTQSFEYSFYFPTAGEFTHFPAHVTNNQKVVAIADQTAFVVDDKPAELDKSSWQYVSQNGSNEDVLEFLNQENLMRVNLDKIAFRMKEADFFKRTIETLRSRYVFSNTLWAYSVMHDEIEALNEFLQQSHAFVSQCGIQLESTPLTIDPVKQRWYEHRDYSPLINAREHQVGRNRTILNSQLFAQYTKLMTVFANQTTLDSEDRLALTYYLLLQNRIEEAIAEFKQVDKSEIAEQVQYDYFDAYINMYLEKPERAAAIAKTHAEHPVDRWRTRFQTVLAHVEEIRSGATTTVDPDNRTESQTEMAARAASFDFSIESGSVEVTYQNLEQLQVNYYQMDVELLFSRNPFGQTSSDGFSLIQPNDSQVIKLDDSGKTSFEIPDELQNKNVTVEITSPDQSKSRAYFAHSMSVQVTENYGQLRIATKESGAPIPKTYIKVYAKSADGRTAFFKDGYTDLRGRFDYATQSNSPLDGITQFSILIMSEEHGTTVRQASPPKE